MVSIDDKICKIALELELQEAEQILFHDWQRMCIASRIGMDPRTARSWLEVAISEDLIRPLKSSFGRRSVIWRVNRVKVALILGREISVMDQAELLRSEKGEVE